MHLKTSLKSLSRAAFVGLLLLGSATLVRAADEQCYDPIPCKVDTKQYPNYTATVTGTSGKPRTVVLQCKRIGNAMQAGATSPSGHAPLSIPCAVYMYYGAAGTTLNIYFDAKSDVVACGEAVLNPNPGDCPVP